MIFKLLKCSYFNVLFIHANSSEKAFNILQEEKIDLIIEMLSTGETDAFALAHQFKAKHPNIPIVVLTHFSREVSIKLENEGWERDTSVEEPDEPTFA